MNQFKIPILYLIFNRPDLVRETFPLIKRKQPQVLFIASDGPREDHPDDFRKVSECRNWILSQIDWECDVSTLFRENNLGCGKAVSEAITWFFNTVENGIILEDDLLFSNDFLDYAATSLERYRNEKYILHIAGTNVLNKTNKQEKTSFLSKYANVWGWATWRDRWSNFIWDPQSLSESTKSHYRLSKKEILFWEGVGQKLHSLEIDSWAYRWQLSIWNKNGYALTPSVNLVRNIGFHGEGTHTSDPKHPLANLEVRSIKTILEKLDNISTDPSLDYKIFEKAYLQKLSFGRTLKNRAIHFIPEVQNYYSAFKKWKKKY